MTTLHGYVLVTYGPHPGQDIFGCLAARRQIRNLQALANARGYKLRIAYDYQRHVTDLSSLPTLQRILEDRKQAGNGLLFVDSLTWLLQRPEPKLRVAFASELRFYGKHLHGMLERSTLQALTNQQVSDHLSTNMPLLRLGQQQRASTKAEATERVRPATEVSKTAREAKSLRLAEALAAIRTELRAAGMPARLQDIAKAANERGLRTQRGTPWSEASISRALKKLEGAEQ